MGIDFSDFNADELWEYSYNEVVALIEEFEKNLIITSNIAENIEAITGTLSCIPIITYRVDEYNFEEISREKVTEDNKAWNDRQLLQLRLRTLHFSCKAFCESVNIANDYNQKKKELEEAVSDLQKKFGETKDRIDLSLEDAQKQVTDSLDSNESKMNNLVNQVQGKLSKAEKKLDDSEHNMLTHVLTLMGVFSAVITIIMSVVITSTAWLNNADGASAIIAFIIPNAVAVLAVITLLFLVFLYHNATTGSNTHPIKSKSACVFFIILFLIIIILSGSLIWVATTHTQKCKPEHTHYIISSAEYTIRKQETTDTNNQDLYFQFRLGEKNYCFRFDEEYIHDGDLYFCQEHNTLE